MWQEIIVGICILTAAAFLVRRWIFPAKKSSACGGCGGCSKTNDAGESSAGCANPAEKNSL